MPRKRKLYFAHPVNTYNTFLEKAMIRLIGEYFPHVIIENPNQWNNDPENILHG